MHIKITYLSIVMFTTNYIVFKLSFFFIPTLKQSQPNVTLMKNEGTKQKNIFSAASLNSTLGSSTEFS